TDMFVASYSTSGGLVWAKRFGGATANQVSGQGISADAAGNSYVTGYFSGFGSVVFGPASLVATGGINSDVFVAKLNSAGNVIWATRAGGTGKDAARSIVTDASGNSMIAGSFRGTITFGSATLTSAGSSTDDVFIARYNTSGGLLWAEKALSGSNTKKVTGVATDALGNYYLTGSYKGTALFGNISFSTLSGESMYVAKFSGSGNVVWVRQTGGGTSVLASGNSIAADAQGNTFVTGSFTGTSTFSSTISLSSSGLSDVFVTKYSTAGNVQWAVKAGNAGADAGTAIAADANGNFQIGGTFQSSISFGSTSLTSAAGSSDVFIARLGTNSTTANSIVTGNISPVVLSPGSTVSVPFAVSGTFISGNTFTAQLSDASGSFTNPVAIGSVTSTVAGNIAATIPASAINGVAYRIRVVASNPATTGSDNGVDITIASMPVVTAAASTTNLAVGSVLTLSVTNPDPTSTYTWTGNSLLSTTGATVTAQPMATGTFSYTVTATNAIGSASSSVTVNVICVPPPLATVAPGFICGASGTATLTASSAGATSYSWYSTSASTAILHVGNIFTTPVLTANRNYYVLAEVEY
ncbi:MAG: hypothetical protein EOP49_28535, partial [Sphingobacteriales bacterium]